MISINIVADDERKGLTAASNSLETNLKTVTNKITVAAEESNRLLGQSELDVGKLRDSIEQAIALVTVRKEALEELFTPTRILYLLSMATIVKYKSLP